MTGIADLFGKSPFTALGKHMEKVAACVFKIKELFTALKSGDQARIEALAEEISKLEHGADEIKNEIRNKLPWGMFLPMSRANFLEILSIQDRIADSAEDIGILLALRKLKTPTEIDQKLEAFLDKNLECFSTVKQIIDDMPELLEFSFSGSHAKKAVQLSIDVAYQEHQVDLLQRELVKALHQHEDQFTVGEFCLMDKLFSEVASISNLSENLGNRVRMTLSKD